MKAGGKIGKENPSTKEHEKEEHSKSRWPGLTAVSLCGSDRSETERPGWRGPSPR